MRKSKLIILFPNKFRKFDWQRFDLPQLEKNYDFEIEIHDLGSILYNKKKIFLGEPFKKAIQFENFFVWKKHFRKNISDNNNINIAVLNFVKVENFYSFLINLELKKSKFKILEFASLQHPAAPAINFNFSILLRKILIGLRNPKVVHHFLIFNFFKILSNFLELYPTYALKCGSDGFRSSFNKKKIKIVEFNAYDYSMFLNSKSHTTIRSDNEGDYALFLESAGPLFPGDNIFRGLKMKEIFSIENWFPPLNKFFDHLENLLKLKVKIAPHPRSNHLNKFPDYYGNREIISEKISIATKDAKVIISRNSAGLSFGAIYKKPIIMIISDELKSYDFQYEYSKNVANDLGVDLININEKFEKEKILRNLNFNQSKYSEYVKKYLTLRDDRKPNFEILNELINEKL